MKLNKINKKGLTCILLSGFILISGCSNARKIALDSKKESFEHSSFETTTESYTDDTTQATTESYTDDTTQATTESYIEDTTETTTEPYIEDTTEATTEPYTDNDNIVIDSFNSLNNKIDEFLNSDNVNDIKQTSKEIFITIVDFIFYDGEIKGVTFDQLTDSGKQRILEIASNIDNKIENKFPNYKDTISNTAKDAFNKASSLIKKGANNIKEFSKEKLGEDNYNKIIEAKNEFIFYTKNAIEIIGDFGSDIFEDGKEYIKEWYDKFKGN